VLTPLVLPVQRLATVAAGVAFLAGQYAADCPAAPIAVQARNALDRLDGILPTIGSTRDRLLWVLVYLADIARDREGFTRVWNDWIAGRAAPSLTMVQVGLAAPEYRVVVLATAAVD